MTTTEIAEKIMNNVIDYSPSHSACMSDDVRQLAAAMIKAKRSFKATGLSGTNSHQKYNYAKINDIYNAVDEALIDNDIQIQHSAVPVEGIEYLYTRLIHAPTGQWQQDVRPLESEKPGNQGKGISNTYMRKLAVLSLCAIAAGEDDDGVEEQKHIEKHGISCISYDQEKEIRDFLKTAKNKIELAEDIKDRYKITELKDLPANKFGGVMREIHKNRVLNEQ